MAVVLAALLVSLTLAADGDPEETPEAQPTVANEVRPLTDKRWEDRAFGVSIRQPMLARVTHPEGSLVELVDEQKLYTLTVSSKRSPQRIPLEDAMDVALESMMKQQNTNQLVERPRRMEVAGREVGVLKFHSPQASGKPVFVAFGIVPIDMVNFVVLELRCDFTQRNQADPIFEDVLRSVRFTDLRELQQARKQQLDLTREWRRDLFRRGVAKVLHEAIMPEQWLRMTENGRDVGYVHMTQAEAERELREGILVTVRSRVQINGRYIDSLDQYFLSDDDSMEAWSQRATERPRVEVLAPKGKPATQHPTIVKTGIRAGPHLTVTIDDPKGAQTTDYVRPDTGYLSQVEAWMLPQILPIDRPGVYGFYYFNPEERKITFRTDQVVPVLGQYRVITRLTPNAPEIHATYDRNRRLIEKRAGNVRVVRSSREEIENIWRNR